MNTKELISILKLHPCMQNCQVHVCASNQLEYINITKKPICIIVNSDIIDKPGSHWSSIYIDKFGEFQYCCSYGQAPTENSIFISNFFQLHCKTFLQNTRVIQSETSTICGGISVYFLIKRQQGLSMRNILKHFRNDLNYNERLIADFLCKQFGYCKFKRIFKIFSVIN